MTFCWHNDNSLKCALVSVNAQFYVFFFTLLQRTPENSGNSILFEIEFLDKNEKNICVFKYLDPATIENDIVYVRYYIIPCLNEYVHGYQPLSGIFLFAEM